MSSQRPRNIIDPEDVGILILPDLPPEMSDAVEALRKSGIKCVDISNVVHPAWTNPKLWALMDTPQWRQLIIIANDAGPYEIGLATMALEKGFSVYFVSPPTTADGLGAQRLRQASAILISMHDLVEELGH